MKKVFALFIIIAAFNIVQCDQNVGIEADKEAIKKMHDIFDNTLAAADVEGNLAVYTNDFTFMLPNKPAISGKEAMRDWLKTVFDQFSFESKHVPDKIDIVDDRAIVPGQFTGLMTPKSGGMAQPFNFKYLHIYRKQPDGTWKLSIEIFNSNDPLPVNK